MQFCSKFIQETVYQISPESPEFRGRYYKNILVLCFSGHIVNCSVFYTGINRSFVIFVPNVSRLYIYWNYVGYRVVQKTDHI